jgi:DNA polymerase elongation subunit (family B)
MSETVPFDIETTGVSPISSRIIMIGIGDNIFFNKDEKELLKDFQAYLKRKSHKNVRITGWKIKTYDIPFCNIRALKYGIALPFERSAFEIEDLAEFFQYEPEPIRPSDLADFLGLSKHKEESSHIPDVYLSLTNDALTVERIKKHLRTHIEFVMELRDKLYACGWLQSKKG